MPSKRPSIFPEALRKLSRRPVSSRWRYCEGRVSSRLVRRRGSQKRSESRTPVRGRGLRRAWGLLEVSTTTGWRCVESSIGLPGYPGAQDGHGARGKNVFEGCPLRAQGLLGDADAFFAEVVGGGRVVASHLVGVDVAVEGRVR